MLALQVNPVVVRVVEAPTQETTVADILMGAVAFVGFVLLAALLAGLVGGGLFILFRKLRTRLRGDDTAPSISVSHLKS